MKKPISLLLTLAMLAGLLCACRPSAAEPGPDQTPAGSPAAPPADTAPASPEPGETELSCREMMMSVWGVLDLPFTNPEMYSASGDLDQERVNTYIEGAYGLGAGEWEDVCAIRDGDSAVELAVLRFAGEDAAARGYDCLSEYLQRRREELADTAPGQARLAADAALVSRGRYVGMFIVKNTALAERTFADILETGKLPEPEPEPEPTDDVNELLDFLLSKCEVWGEDISNVERVDGGEAAKLRSVVEDTYGLADLEWTEAAIARGTDSSVFEIAVLRAADGQKAWKLVRALVDYLDTKEAEYARFPAQAELLSQAMAGNPDESGLVIMAVCGNPRQLVWAAADRTGAKSFSTVTRHQEELETDYDPDYPDRVLFTRPGKEDMSLYDTAAIRAAWEKGDPAGLSDADRAVYGAAKEILGRILREDMTQLEKETAIYTWLVDNVNYDWRHQDVMAETPRTSYQPYGGLVDRTAVCLGYAASFQLLCDLSGIECITVVGACFNSEEDHAWNMVRLEEAWYCVDVTWDANGREQLGGSYAWKYFNVTSEKMAENHQWDYANTPEAR